jgi:hypothetical protein
MASMAWGGDEAHVNIFASASASASGILQRGQGISYVPIHGARLKGDRWLGR